MTPTVLFDFDGTLVRGDSFAAFLKLLLRDRPLRALPAVLGLPLLPPAFAWWPTARLAAAGYLWLATVGRAADELEAHRHRFLAQCGERRRQLLIVPAIERLRHHLDAGHRVAIVTGAEQRLARQLWSALDGPEVPVWVGSRLRPGFGGWLPERHCFGPRKLDALAEAGIVPPFSVVYTDSVRDLPLLRHAQHRVLVAPTAATVRRVRRVCGDVEVIAPID
ncbi:MAG TPA: phosphoserine phosphatase [Xanthomonadales bacterium]|nr:phosphoserine phosphatase [Xanthomonadales bacterium]